jgi:DNA adenine methylase
MANRSSEINKPILRWAGSKKKSLRHLLPLVSASLSSRYIEVFAGSAALFFAANPQKAILADNNANLVEFYKTISRSPSEVFAQFTAFQRTKEKYLEIRHSIKCVENSIEKAAQFLFLNRNCFNGIYRTNASGHFNVPFASDRVAAYPNLEAVERSALALSRASFVDDDFEAVCRREVKRGDLVYLDPPYYLPTSRVFREYSSQPFCQEDLLRLEKLLRFIDAKGAKFILSYPDCSWSRSIRKSWNVKQFPVVRTVSGNSSMRRSKREIAMFNFDVAHD